MSNRNLTETVVVISLVSFILFYIIPVNTDWFYTIDIRVFWVAFTILLLSAYINREKIEKNHPDWSVSILNGSKLSDIEFSEKVSINRYAFALIIVTIISSLVHFYKLGSLSLATDENLMMAAVQSVADSGKPIFPDGTIYSRGLLHIYISWLFSLVLGVNELTTRLPSAISNTLLVPLLYFVTRDIINNRRVGIIVSITWGLFPWAVEFSRWGRFYSLLSLLYVSVFYFTYLGFKNKRTEYIILSVLLSGLMIITSKVGYIGPVVVITGYVLWGAESIDPFNLAKILLISALFIPMANAINVILVKPSLLTDWSSVLISPYYDIYSHFDYKRFFSASFHQHHLLLNLGYIYFFGYILTRKRRLTNRNLFLLVFSYSPLVILSYFNLHPAPRYLFFFMPLFITASLIGMYELIKAVVSFNISFEWDTDLSAILLLTLCIVLVVNIGAVVDIVERDHGDEYSNIYYSPSPVHEVHADSRSAAQYVINNASDSDIIIVDDYVSYYAYGNEQPDYYLRPKGDVNVRYLNETEMLSNYTSLNNVVKNNKEKTIWLALNLNRGHNDLNDIRHSYVEKLDDNYNTTKVSVGETSGPIVVRIE